MSFARTIVHNLEERKWKLLCRALESRIFEIYKWRESHREEESIVAECDKELQACYDLMEEIKIK